MCGLSKRRHSLFSMKKCLNCSSNINQNTRTFQMSFLYLHDLRMWERKIQHYMDLCTFLYCWEMFMHFIIFHLMNFFSYSIQIYWVIWDSVINIIFLFQLLWNWTLSPKGLHGRQAQPLPKVASSFSIFNFLQVVFIQNCLHINLELCSWWFY